jgi:hypothetical protein
MLRKFSWASFNPAAMKRIILLAGIITALIAFFVANTAQSQQANVKPQPYGSTRF